MVQPPEQGLGGAIGNQLLNLTHKEFCNSILIFYFHLQGNFEGGIEVIENSYYQ